jgi:L-asparaginase
LNINYTRKQNDQDKCGAFQAFTSPYPAGRIWGSFKYEKRIVLARNKGEIEVHKTLDNNVVIVKMFPGMSEAVLSAILAYQV